MIYFLKSPTGPIKIGTTVRLSSRLRQLSSHRGEPLEILGVADGSYETESVLHERFSHLRCFGEWFEPGDDLLRFIDSETRRWDGEDEKSADCPLRVSDEFAEAIREAASLDGLSVREFADRYLLGPARAHFRDAVLARAKQYGVNPE